MIQFLIKNVSLSLLNIILFSSFLSEYYSTFLPLDNCRQMEFKAVQTFDGKRLKNHVIHATDVTNSDFCEVACYVELNCVSYNLRKVANGHGKYKCELNNSTFEGQKDKLEINSEYIYRGSRVMSVSLLN